MFDLLFKYPRSVYARGQFALLGAGPKWLLVLLIALQYATAEFGLLDMNWHFRFGYATLGAGAVQVEFGHPQTDLGGDRKRFRDRRHRRAIGGGDL